MISKFLFLIVFPILTLAKFQLQVEQDGQDGSFVRFLKYDDNVRVVYDAEHPAGCECEEEVPFFTFDGKLWDTSVNLPLAISGDLAYHNLVLYTNASTTGFGGFTICEGYVQHDGNDTFYTSNSYPYNKYVNFITTNATQFLAEPVKLKIVNQT